MVVPDAYDDLRFLRRFGLAHASKVKERVSIEAAFKRLVGVLAPETIPSFTPQASSNPPEEYKAEQVKVGETKKGKTQEQLGCINGRPLSLMPEGYNYDGFPIE